MTTYYDLVIRCSACIADGYSGGYPSQWYHTDCGGKLRIGDNARLRCSKCGHEEHIILCIGDGLANLMMGITNTPIQILLPQPFL